MKKILSAVIAAVMCFSCTAFAKSDSLIDGNIEKMRKMLNERDFRVFTEDVPENSVYYGAKFEPRSGVILGTPQDKMFPEIGNGIDTMYEWLTLSEAILNENVAREEIPETPSDHTKLIGYNWNFASKIPVDMSRYENYIRNQIDRLAALGVDVLLVFGKEMNIDDNFLEEQVFIDCYRYIADYAHTKENIAMVWAPNDTGGLDTRLIDFYPGDEYVDWIGCSLYTMPYFTGDKNANEGANIGFIMGPYANPVMRAKVIHNFMVENNIKKPVFITEGGIGYESPDGEDFTPWALQQLRKYYGEMIRVYPEFKCMVSFNNYVAVGDYYRYDMGNNPELLVNLQYFAQDPIFIQDYTKPSPISYTEVYDGIEFTDNIKLSAYGYIPKVQYMTVRYLIDGEEVHSTSYPPYNFETADIQLGEHHLTVEFYSDNKRVNRQEFDFAFKKSPIRRYNNEEYAGGCDFSDMDDCPNEMKNAAARLSRSGIINGVGDGKFAPDGHLTRAELAAIIVRALDINEESGSGLFSDVDADAWYAGAVGAAKNAGIIDGFEDGTFRPNENVTNEQLIAVIVKYMISLGEPRSSDAAEYTDNISGWAREYVNTAAKMGIALGYDDGEFKGGENVERGDAAVIIRRFLENIVN